MTVDPEAARESNAWPFAEARKVLARLARAPGRETPIVFETGYGPSGLPHIGTFCEVARTEMVRHAFHTLSGHPTRLIVFSDDMDGMRRIPSNIPAQERLREHLDKPLSRVPDPWDCHDSFAHHNNAKLREFLDHFGFDYEFLSASDCYGSGRFDETLLRVLAHYDEVRDAVLPIFGPERRATYSPILPISPKTGRVLQTGMEEVRPKEGTILFRDEEGARVELPVTGGHCKLQWRVDWAMRWTALGVDYEMSGKDLIDSVTISTRITRILGAEPPETLIYEHFLGEEGERISKSRGNGLTIDEWLRYASPESLAHYMYQTPRKAKRLYFDVIPRNVDDYLTNLERYAAQDEKARLQNPVWHIHEGNPPRADAPISFAMLLNLVSASNSEDPRVLWGFISRYVEGATPESHPMLGALVHYAVAYYHDFVRPRKRYRPPDEQERRALEELLAYLDTVDGRGAAIPEALQEEIYEIGKRHGFEPLRDWFRALYEVLLGESQGPRMGSFIALYGIEETKALLRRALAGEDLKERTV